MMFFFSPDDTEHWKFLFLCLFTSGCRNCRLRCGQSFSPVQSTMGNSSTGSWIRGALFSHVSVSARRGTTGNPTELEFYLSASTIQWCSESNAGWPSNWWHKLHQHPGACAGESGRLQWLGTRRRDRVGLEWCVALFQEAGKYPRPAPDGFR